MRAIRRKEKVMKELQRYALAARTPAIAGSLIRPIKSNARPGA
jgi:hypothetical protein